MDGLNVDPAIMRLLFFGVGMAAVVSFACWLWEKLR